MGHGGAFYGVLELDALDDAVKAWFKARMNIIVKIRLLYVSWHGQLP